MKREYLQEVLDRVEEAKQLDNMSSYDAAEEKLWQLALEDVPTLVDRIKQLDHYIRFIQRTA